MQYPTNPYIILPIDNDIPIPEDVMLPAVPLEDMREGDSIAFDIEDMKARGISEDALRLRAKNFAVSMGRSPKERWHFKGKRVKEEGRWMYRVWRLPKAFEDWNIRIDSGVPAGYVYMEDTRLIDEIARMQAGDSILLPASEIGGLVHNPMVFVRHLRRTTGGRWKYKKTSKYAPDSPGGRTVSGIRLWRIE